MITKKNKKITYYFNLMSYDQKALESAVQLYKKSFEEKNLILQGPVFIPKYKKNLVLIRSPHVNKASREIFQFKKYKNILILNFPKDDSIVTNKKLFESEFNLNNFLKKMCLLDIAGVSIQIKKIF
jgi:small subunit ribosomal protein S10